MKILVVIDMQNDFVDGALGTKEAVGIVPAVLHKIEDFPGPVLYTRDTHGEDYLQTLEGKNLPVIHCVKGTKGWQLVDEIRMLASEDAIIDKPTFGSMKLPEAIDKCSDGEEIESITLIGLCTDICVISNAMILKAAFPDVPIIIDADCCAGVTPASHRTALDAMSACQIEIDHYSG